MPDDDLFGAYADSTAGHTTTDTSRDRAIRERADGTLSVRLSKTLGWTAAMGSHGVTWKDLADISGWHHGQASAALTNLHIEGRIVRLAAKRNRCHIYVLPEFVMGRDTLPYTPQTKTVECPACGHHFTA